MKFLTKIGKVLLQGITIAAGLAPLVQEKYQTVVEKSVDVLKNIYNVIVQVEVFGQSLNLSGADKLKAAIPAVGQVILQSDLLFKKKIRDQALFNAGVEKVTSGFADIFNSIDESEVKEA